MLKIGAKAPDFTAPDQIGALHKLSEYKGRWVLLYFYPRDNTPGCTAEACSLRDNFTEFKKIDAVILGVSTDSVKSHANFANKYQLPFTILADSDEKIVKAYGADGLLRRISYLINPNGQIVQVYGSIKPNKHAAEVLRDLRVFKNGP
ncbi:MAG: peroxiredoxin [Candidatus Falkowbacteria bacterium]|nr:peroxiredoxin [Candidatus Falkowbacteria bacterium]